MSSTIHDPILIDIPKIHNELGNLSVIEGNIIPFEIGQVQYLYNVSNQNASEIKWSETQQIFLVALNGSFEIQLKTDNNNKSVTLSKPNVGLYIPAGVEYELQDFSVGAVCLTVSSKVADNTISSEKK